MKKSKTEFLSFNKIRFIPTPQKIISKKEYKIQQQKKVEKELNSKSEEFRKILKENLSKNEITKEIYLSKNISQDKKQQKDLLAFKIDNCEKFMKKKKILRDRLSQENSFFINTYEQLKKDAAKKEKLTSQEEYLNAVSNLYINKNYDLSKNGIYSNENIFKYSILNDIQFGDNINNDVLRVIKEMNNNDFLKEQKLIFDFQDELLKQKLGNKSNHPVDSLFKKFKLKEKDYSINDMNIINRNKTRLKTDINLINNNNNAQPRPSFLYIQMKNDIKKMQSRIMNLEELKNNNHNNNENSLAILKEALNKKKPDLDIKNTNSSFDKKNPVLVIDIEDKLNKDIKPIIEENKDIKNKNIGNKIIKLDNKFKKRFSVMNLQSINKPFKELSLATKPQNTNPSTNINKNADKYNLKDTPKIIRKNIMSKTRINPNIYLATDSKDQFKDINNLINLKKVHNIALNTFLKYNINKKHMTRQEIEKTLKKLKNNKKSKFESLSTKPNKINLHGFVSQFQKITEDKKFGILQNKNKYLKKNNFSYLMSNQDMFLDNDEGINLNHIDEKIGDIMYDSADYLLGSNIANKN